MEAAQQQREDFFDNIKGRAVTLHQFLQSGLHELLQKATKLAQRLHAHSAHNLLLLDVVLKAIATDLALT